MTPSPAVAAAVAPVAPVGCEAAVSGVFGRVQAEAFGGRTGALVRRYVKPEREADHRG